MNLGLPFFMYLFSYLSNHNFSSVSTIIFILALPELLMACWCSSPNSQCVDAYEHRCVDICCFSRDSIKREKKSYF